MIAFLLHVLGIDDLSGRWYGFWSGFGSDLGEVGIVVALLRRHVCEVHRCWRLGLHQTAAGHRVCRRHHPDDHLTVQDVTTAHEIASGTADT